MTPVVGTVTKPPELGAMHPPLGTIKLIGKVVHVRDVPDEVHRAELHRAWHRTKVCRAQCLHAPRK